MTLVGVLILAAGQGSRIQSDTPKILQAIAGKPMLYYVIQSVLKIKPDYMAIVLSPSVLSLLATHIPKDLYPLEQVSPTGTAKAVMAAEAFFKDKVDQLLVIGADCPLITFESLQQLIDSHIRASTPVSLLSSSLCKSDDMGIINRDPKELITFVSEQKGHIENHASESPLELNAGIYCFDNGWLWDQVGNVKQASSGEFHLPDLIATAYSQKQAALSVDPKEPKDIFGVNTMGQLAQAESWMYQRHNETLMENGVRIHDPNSVFIDTIAVISNSAEIKPNTIIEGATYVGSKSVLGPNACISNSTIGEASHLENSSCVTASIGSNVSVGPYCHLREGTAIGDDVVIGTGVEIKNSQIGKRSRIHHFSYIGDCEIGLDVNVGAGTVTCNYDGKEKHKTVIGDGAFIGSASMLVAPLVIGRMAKTGAGAVVVNDVSEGNLVFGVPATSPLEKRSHASRCDCDA